MTRTVGDRREDGRMLRDVAQGMAEAIRADPAIAAQKQKKMAYNLATANKTTAKIRRITTKRSL